MSTASNLVSSQTPADPTTPICRAQSLPCLRAISRWGLSRAERHEELGRLDQMRCCADSAGAAGPGLEQELRALLTLCQLLRMAMVTAVETWLGTSPGRASFTTAMETARPSRRPEGSRSWPSSAPILAAPGAAANSPASSGSSPATS